LVISSISLPPALHFAEWLPITVKWIARAFGIVRLATIVAALAYKERPRFIVTFCINRSG